MSAANQSKLRGGLMLRRSNFGTQFGNLILSFLGFFVFALPVHAANLKPGPVVSSYNACSWRDNGDGTSTVKVAIRFARYIWVVANGFYSRGILVYGYNKLGRPIQNSAIVRELSMNGVNYSDEIGGSSYIVYSGLFLPQWSISDPLLANVEILIDNSQISQWPAISVQAGNIT
ncbi:hypothetical protein GRT41_34140, partial [Burkholderia pseudomallei]|nr:hypothetical protein [Burkholderia pseudomallei]